MGAQHINTVVQFRDHEQLRRTSPTLADGLTAEQEGRLRREQYRTVLNAGRRLNLCAPALNFVQGMFWWDSPSAGLFIAAPSMLCQTLASMQLK